MRLIKLEKELRENLEELINATIKRDAYELEYEYEKARMFFSAEVNGLANQIMRDAQVLLLLKENGMYDKMANLRTDAKIAWYKWSSVKSLIDGKAVNE